MLAWAGATGGEARSGGTPAQDPTTSHQLVLKWAGSSAVGPDGSYYVTGSTSIDGMQSTPGVYQEPDSNHRGAFVARFDPTGKLVWLLTIGGKVDAEGGLLAIGPDGTVYLTGSFRGDSGFPTTSDAMATHYADSENSDEFLAEFSPDGSTLEHSTVLPGLFTITGLTLDEAGRPVVTGSGYSDLTGTPGAFQETPHVVAGSDPEFVAEVRHDGSAFRWLTFLDGTTGDDLPRGLAMAPDGSVVVAGLTGSSDFPLTAGAYDNGDRGNSDIYVSKLSADGSTLLASARFGAHENEWEDLGGMTVSSDGSVWAGGVIDAPDFPTTPDAWFPTKPRTVSGWLAHLSPGLDSLDFSTFVPGRVHGIRPVPAGGVVAEVTASVGWPNAADDGTVPQFVFVSPGGTLDHSFGVAVPPISYDIDGAGSIWTVSDPPPDSSPTNLRVRGRRVNVSRYTRCTIVGTPGNDVLRGTRGPDVICGKGGDDLLIGGGGADVLVGGRGHDVLRGGNGIDILEGGRGNDVLVGGPRRDLLVGGAGRDRLLGGRGADTLRGGSSVDRLVGGPGRDQCFDTGRTTRRRGCEMG